MATKPAAKTAVPAKKPGTAVAPVASQTTALGTLDQDMLADLAGDLGAGLEKASQQDYALPFVYLLQKTSPQVDATDPKHIDGAKAGMFLNTVTGEIFEKLRVIPADFEKTYIEWVPRDAGGGFVGSYKTKADAEANLTEGNQIVDTANHYVLLQSEDGSWSPAIVSMTSTKLKASRKWLSMMSMVTIPVPGGGRKVAPTYARMYDILPEGPVKNDKGTFFILKVAAVEGEEGWVKDANLREAARNFRASLEAGTKGADYSAAADAVVEDAEVDGEPKY